MIGNSPDKRPDATGRSTDPARMHRHGLDLIWPTGYDRRYHGCPVCGQPAPADHACAMEEACAVARRDAAALTAVALATWHRLHDK